MQSAHAKFDYEWKLFYQRILKTFIFDPDVVLVLTRIYDNSEPYQVWTR